MHRLLDGGNTTMRTAVLSVELHGCTKDGVGCKCDISSHVKSLFYAPTVPGAKPSPPGARRDNIVDTYRLVWSNQSTEWLPITKQARHAPPAASSRRRSCSAAMAGPDASGTTGATRKFLLSQEFRPERTGPGCSS